MIITPSAIDRPPGKILRATLWVLLIFFVFFGVVVEFRSAFLTHRRTDADDFFRGAWGIRKHKDIYDLVDTQEWHYNYPPFFAIAIAPLANPPPFPDPTNGWMIQLGQSGPLENCVATSLVVQSLADSDRAGMLPYGLSIAIWYITSVIALALAVHWLAGVIEGSFSGPLSKKPPLFCARWWLLRVIPILVCLPSIGRSLSRGQVNLFIILLFCGVVIFIAKKRNTWAGWCIAAAASVKIFPAYIGVHALVRRDWKCVAGCFIGTFFFIVLVPLVVMGPHRTEACYRKFFAVLLEPAMGAGGDQTRATELTDATGTDSQSFMTLIHNTIYPVPPRPPNYLPWVRPVHWALSLLITATTLWFGRRARPGDEIYNTVFLGTLVLAMVPISPVAHTHYWVFAFPLVAGLTAYSWDNNGAPRLSRGFLILFAVHILANVIGMPQGKYFMILKAVGVAFYGTMILWVAGIVALNARAKTPLPVENKVTP